MSLDKDIHELIEKYSTDIDFTDEFSRSKLDIIRDKIEDLDYQRHLPGETEDITVVLLYEYATNIEKLTKGKVLYKDVVNKLISLMGKIRYGEWIKRNR